MRTEAIRTENTNIESTLKRYGVIRDFGARERDQIQNARITREIDRAQVRARPEALDLTARAFQLELFRRAQERNIIAVLDTGVK